MDIKSLMVGDWVYNKHHGRNIRLTPYDFFTHTHNEFGEQELAPFAKPTIGRDLEPIPLTPEILEKNGFEDYDSYATLDTENYRVIYAFDGFITIVDDDNQRKVSYLECDDVHVLQHALRLCGINKEIVL